VAIVLLTERRHDDPGLEELMAMAGQDEVDILLVEDDPDDAQFALRALSRSATQPRVLHLDDGARALAYLFGEGEFAARALQAHPRVVLLDLKLTKVNGIDVLRRLKEDRRTRDIAVVVYSSSREPRDLEACYLNRANSYVVKPVNFEAFTRTMGDIARYWIEINEAPCARTER
jgi:two-component system response regulator